MTKRGKEICVEDEGEEAFVPNGKKGEKGKWDDGSGTSGNGDKPTKRGSSRGNRRQPPSDPFQSPQPHSNSPASPAAVPTTPTPVPTPTPAPAPVAPPQQENSLKGELLQRAKALEGSGNQLRQTLAEADEAGATPEIVNLFAELIRRGDEIGIRRFSFTRPPQEARKEWLNLSWADQEKMLRKWSEEDEKIKEIMETLSIFSKNIILRDLLRQVVVQFERPCRGIDSHRGLVLHLRSLVQKGLALEINNPRQNSSQGVAIPQGPQGRDAILFFPAKDIRIARLGWMFIQKAEERAKKNKAEQEEKILALKAKATPGLTPLGVSAGREGFLFLSLGWNQGVLIEAVKKNGQIMARVMGSPAWVLWSPETNYIPLRGHWPLRDREIPPALKSWEEKEKARNAKIGEIRERQKQEKIISPIEVVKAMATFPVAFEGQGLTQLLKGEVGVAGLYIQNLEWGRWKGLFALAIERRQDDEGFLRLAEAISANPQHKEALSCIRGKRLPRMTIREREKDGSLEAKFNRLPRMKPEVFSALRMVEKAVQMRLNAEFRASISKP